MSLESWLIGRFRKGTKKVNQDESNKNALKAKVEQTTGLGNILKVVKAHNKDLKENEEIEAMEDKVLSL